MIEFNPQSDSDILLPKGHLSWSQMEIWRSSKDRYKREYFENADKLSTQYTKFGSMVAKLIETGEYKKILPDLPVYRYREMEVRAVVDGVPTLSYIDGYWNGLIGEYKTGKIPWTQTRVQKHDQLVFYAAVVSQHTFQKARRTKLHWIETRHKEETDTFWARMKRGELEVTGRIETFDRLIDDREVERIEKKIRKTAEEISKEYKQWLSNI